MYSKYTLVCLAAAVPGLALGQNVTSYQCSLDDMQRRIEILTEPGVTVPCAVHYYKDTEMPGETEVLWTATTEAGFCESKTEAFVAKLRDTGWQCTPQGAAKPEPIADDTDALEPAQEQPADQQPAE